MDILFADDSNQEKPSRPGMGPLIAAGYIYVPGDNVKSLEDGLRKICEKFHFPPDSDFSEFKWSPNSKLWMHSNLTGQNRTDFFKEIIGELKENKVSATVIVEDKNHSPANPDSEDPFEDVTKLLLERAERELNKIISTGILIFDMPSGGRSDEQKFLWNCFETIASGTKYVKPDHLAINVLSARSELIRCLQAADLITSATLAYISGNQNADSIFPEIKSLLNKDSGRINGVGVKIHPDFRYANLYCWLLGDKYISDGTSLPIPSRPYEKDPSNP